MVPIKLEWFAPVQNALSEVVFGFVFHFCDRSPGAGWLSRTLGVLTLSVLLFCVCPLQPSLSLVRCSAAGNFVAPKYSGSEIITLAPAPCRPKL